MRSHRALTGAAGAALAVCFAGHALAQAAQVIPPELAAAVADWGVCRGHVVVERASGPESAEAIADEAMKRCAPEEARSRATALKTLGPSGGPIADRAVVTARSQVVELVNQRRAGGAISDPSVAWGDCLGRSLRDGAKGKADAGALMDQAFAACREDEQRVTAKLETQASHEQVAALIVQMKGLFRDQGGQLIAQLRQAR